MKSKIFFEKEKKSQTFYFIYFPFKTCFELKRESWQWDSFILEFHEYKRNTWSNVYVMWMVWGLGRAETDGFDLVVKQVKIISVILAQNRFGSENRLTLSLSLLSLRIVCTRIRYSWVETGICVILFGLADFPMYPLCVQP